MKYSLQAVEPMSHFWEIIGKLLWLLRVIPGGASKFFLKIVRIKYVNSYKGLFVQQT